MGQYIFQGLQIQQFFVFVFLTLWVAFNRANISSNISRPLFATYNRTIKKTKIDADVYFQRLSEDCICSESFILPGSRNRARSSAHISDTDRISTIIAVVLPLAAPPGKSNELKHTIFGSKTLRYSLERFRFKLPTNRERACSIRFEWESNGPQRLYGYYTNISEHAETSRFCLASSATLTLHVSKRG